MLVRVHSCLVHHEIRPHSVQKRLDLLQRRLVLRGIPCDVITIDGRAAWEVRTRFAFEWDPARYDDPKRILGELRNRGIIVTQVGPYSNFRDPEGRVIKLSESRTVVVTDPGSDTQRYYRLATPAQVGDN